MEKNFVLKSGGAEFHVIVSGTTGSIYSNCGVKGKGLLSPSDKLFNASIYGVESMIFALARVGVDLDDPRFQEALGMALTAVNNQYG